MSNKYKEVIFLTYCDMYLQGIIIKSKQRDITIFVLRLLLYHINVNYRMDVI